MYHQNRVKARNTTDSDGKTIVKTQKEHNHVAVDRKTEAKELLERSRKNCILKELTEYLKDSRMVVDLGSGNATKTMLILDKLLETHESLTYVPVDISKGCSRRMSADKSQYLSYIDQWTDTMSVKDSHTECAEPCCSHTLDDKLVITFDVTDASRKDIIELSYLDPEGYSENFYLNSIHRLNREMNGNIDVSKFKIKNELVANSKSDNCSYVNVWIEAIENVKKIRFNPENSKRRKIIPERRGRD
ncbi:unnamed protein product [Mytilus edulis]|uniref:Histidine-specific methyltransferase SAM-dependent domain-containing protein n=1 Tax=Mytilus edulis TaxID=6550 RepID=A0A8S3QG25_MYTED|nr:unnamed protein product [Mytilus edulis]